MLQWNDFIVIGGDKIYLIDSKSGKKVSEIQSKPANQYCSRDASVSKLVAFSSKEFIAHTISLGGSGDTSSLCTQDVYYSLKSK